MKQDMLVKQKYLKKGGIIALIAVLSMAPMFSVDMYLPALPYMNAYFAASESVMNLTLVGFYIFMALGLLIFGPLSDKHGRKPILIISLFLYVVFSGLCAISTNIWQLIFFRIIEAIGAGGMLAISIVLIKDSFKGKAMGTILAVVTSISIIAPMIAPIAGAFILQCFKWRAIFVAYAVIGIICLIASFLLAETLPASKRLDGKLINTMGRLVVVGKNKGFTYLLIIASLFAAPYMAYVAVSSYVYIDFFGLSTTTYSYIYGINAACSVLGPLIYIKINGKVDPKKITWLCFVLAVFSGMALIILGRLSPALFLLSFSPFAFVESIMKVFSTDILLNQQEGDSGSASSLINFTQTILGSIGMVIGALPWSNYIRGLGICVLGFTIIGVISWIVLLKSSIYIKGLKEIQNRKQSEYNSCT
ncbi:MFS transporter [Clostridium uliginosum]|uniref:MFS transporter, DHA1 family, bicyclomycin/chloramphenicol resistance protein n=1 Tax=Clostridium uliginosum TaxID=119641 RepID=A0A1I1N6W2_9CLOT|nr:MFS transporter [Clostridium uliginosum]SFC93387.1 MFS transporter, DHA1 family, bicyclomycin/chloramphenicol resistance protein [Clostridium uliginosum]